MYAPTETKNCVMKPCDAKTFGFKRKPLCKHFNACTPFYR